MQYYMYFISLPNESSQSGKKNMAERLGVSNNFQCWRIKVDGMKNGLILVAMVKRNSKQVTKQTLEEK